VTSLHQCILNSNVISLDFIHLFIISADWLLIQFKFLFHLAYIHLHSPIFTYIHLYSPIFTYIHLHSLTFTYIQNQSLHAILTSYCSGRCLSCKLQIWSYNYSTGSNFFWNCSFASDFDFDFINLIFDFAFSSLSWNKTCVPVSYQSLHTILLPVSSKLISILDLDSIFILVIVTFA
jgi:hypothetical protein